MTAPAATRHGGGEERPFASSSGRVHAVPPAHPGGYWRLSCYDDDGHRIAQTTGGRTRQQAARRMAEEELRIASTGLPGSDAYRGDDLLDYFLAADRPKFPHAARRDQAWSATYAQQAAGVVARYLRPVLGSVPLRTWSRAHAYRVLDRCPTNYVVERTRRILSSVLTVGVENGFLRTDQAALHRVTVPLRVEIRPPRRLTAGPARSDQPLLVLAAAVPGNDQVGALAAADVAVSPASRRWWPLWVHLLAYVGLRAGEFFALAAPDVLDGDPRLLTVSRQVVETTGHPKVLAAPKNGFGRLAAVCPRTPQGYQLRQRLQERAEQALVEQRAGLNPDALIVPSPAGGWWTRSNFRSRCFVPAARAAGWPTLPWRGPVRRRRGDRWVTELAERCDLWFTPHSLRHHYACTARDDWGWTVAELCANGGWSDPAFVMSRYYGLTPDLHATALAKQNQPGG